jgi:hypothetical protein
MTKKMKKKNKNGKKWENGCRFHTGEAELSIEGRNVKFVVCRTCGATGPYGENDIEAIRRWYDNLTEDEIELHNVDPEPRRGDFLRDKGDSRMSLQRGK